jgi:hypothetical protein
MPVCTCVPLFSARPSFASSTSGSTPARERFAAPPARRPPPSPRPRRAARARGATAAPGRPTRRHCPARDDRMDAVVQAGRAAARRPARARPNAERQHVRAQQHDRARLRLVQRLADTRRVAADQVDLQLADPVGRDHHLGQCAEAGRDAVDRRAPRGRRARRRRARRGSGCARRRPARRARAEPPHATRSTSASDRSPAPSQVHSWAPL